MDVYIHIPVFGEITEELANKVMGGLFKALEEKRNVTILINSGGGDGDLVMGIIEYFKILRSFGLEIETINLHEASSAAAMLLMAGDPGRRCMAATATTMIHRGSFSFKFEGNAMKGRIKHAQKLTRKFEDIYTTLTGQPRKTVLKWLRTDTFMDVHKCIQYGIVDHIL